MGRKWRRGSIAILAALVLALTAVVFTAVRGAKDDRFDEVEKGFTEQRTAFEDAVDRMAGLQADHPDAMRIGWSMALVCVMDSAGVEDCAATSQKQQTAFEQLSGANTVIWQAKDGGRVFFVFDVENPPVRYLIYDPEGRDPRAYSEAQGFQWGRQIGDRWSVLGHISDVEEQSSMWLR